MGISLKQKLNAVVIIETIIVVALLLLVVFGKKPTNSTAAKPLAMEAPVATPPVDHVGSKEQEQLFIKAQQEGYKAMLAQFMPDDAFTEKEKQILRENLMKPFYEYYAKKGIKYQLMVISLGVSSVYRYEVYATAGGDAREKFTFGSETPLETWTLKN
jgi:hypothetical protein